MQPLDRGLLEPFKTYYKEESITIYNIAACIALHIQRLLFLIILWKASKSQVLFLFNEHIFIDEEFAVASVTDIPVDLPKEHFHQAQEINTEANTSASLHEVHSPENEPSTSKIVTPEVIRPYPKAQSRRGTNRGRYKGKSRILTDTPERMSLVEAKN